MPRRSRGSPITRVLQHEVFQEVLSALLAIGVLYFGVQGALFLALRTDSPMMAVVSDSMKPTFERGDLIIVRGVSSPEEISVNDIIVFKLEGHRVSTVHRVVEVVDQGGRVRFRTKGDANPNPDARLVRPEEVRGKVLFWIPNLGFLSIWLRGG